VTLPASLETGLGLARSLVIYYGQPWRRLSLRRFYQSLIDRYGKPAFCKIDVEGAESQVLAGLSQPLALIAFETIPAMRSDTQAALERLKTLGDYRFNKVVGERHRFVWPDWKRADALLEDLDAQPSAEGSGDIYARLVG
jgi:hypothetical protein